jgi:hypothetical protein
MTSFVTGWEESVQWREEMQVLRLVAHKVP